MIVAVDWHIVWKQLFHPDGVFARALWTTVYMAVIAQALGVVLGLLAAFMRTSKVGVLRLASGIYVWLFRGTPVLVQIFLIYYANLLFGFTVIPNTLNLGLFSLDGAVLAGILALGINEGAYMREIIRAGIDAIDRGQMEAARSLGMTYRLAMQRIVLPQAARVIVPPLGNEFNNMLKTTSLVTIIGVHELFQDSEIRYSQDFKPVEYFGAVAMWYLLLTTLWTFVQAWIERKLTASERDTELSFRDRLVEAWTPRTAWARGR